MKTSLFVAFLLLLGAPAQAARWALVVGNNTGLGPDSPLRYAESDAQRIASVLVELGGFEAARMRVLRAPSAAAVETAFAELSAQILSAGDDKALLFFFFSGHADGSSLHLGNTTMDLTRLRDLLTSSGAAVRIGVLDACGAGALTSREKGLAQAEPFLFTAPPELGAKGQVIIAAVSASEAAQESDALRGSFFTTYLVTGLRGAADRSGTGRVTLDDAYRFAHAQTVRATLLSRSGTQHPSFDMNLSGQGDLVLTEPLRGRARLIVRAEERGVFAIFAGNETLVAEFALEPGAEALLALEPGGYEVHKRGASSLRFARVAVKDGDERVLPESRMQEVDYVPLARKGATNRFQLSVGYANGLLASPSGAPVLRLAVDVAWRHLLLMPRLTASYVQWTSNGTLAASSTEADMALGLGVGSRWERGRHELRAGAAVDAVGTLQRSFGLSSYALSLSLAAPFSYAQRVAGGLSICIDLEPALALVNTGDGVRLRPHLLLLLGVRYDL